MSNISNTTGNPPTHRRGIFHVVPPRHSCPKYPHFKSPSKNNMSTSALTRCRVRIPLSTTTRLTTMHGQGSNRRRGVSGTIHIQIGVDEDICCPLWVTISLRLLIFSKVRKRRTSAHTRSPSHVSVARFRIRIGRVCTRWYSSPCPLPCVRSCMLVSHWCHQSNVVVIGTGTVVHEPSSCQVGGISVASVPSAIPSLKLAAGSDACA